MGQGTDRSGCNNYLTKSLWKLVISKSVRMKLTTIQLVNVTKSIKVSYEFVHFF